MVDYGEYTIEVLQGQMKFNIESASWPFCGPDHTLEVTLDLKVPGDKPPTSVVERDEEDEEEEQESGARGGKGRRPKRKAMRQSAGAMDADFDLPEVALADGAEAACGVDVSSQGAKTSIIFAFPAFEDTMLYDPTLGFALPDGGGVEPLPPPRGPETSTTYSTSTTSTTTATSLEGQDEAVAERVVTGSSRLTVADPSAFCSSPAVLVGLRAALARASGQAPDAVRVACAASRRLERRAARRLAGAVDMSYDIAIWGDSADGTVAASVVAALGALTDEELTTMVNEELERAGAGVAVVVIGQAPAQTDTRGETESGGTVAPWHWKDVTDVSLAERSGPALAVALSFAALAVAS
mmetsp:Transcript_126781/g.366969  ORF Transcript_126781/g.366969 Transcript_126781/m.366969 type:complete len:354 (+) Transcript_126781:26-1087(+)